jgi:hypothetical protein
MMIAARRGVAARASSLSTQRSALVTCGIVVGFAAVVAGPAAQIEAFLPIVIGVSVWFVQRRAR